MWQALVIALAEFLLAAGLEWLRERLKSLPPMPLSGDDAARVRAVFAAVRADLTWWERWVQRRGRVVDRAEAACLRHAAALCGDGPKPVASAAEWTEIVYGE